MALGINLFRNLRFTIFIYYFLSVALFLGALHYFLTLIIVENIFFLALVFLSLVAISGIFIASLGVDPLEEYVINLQNLSKETLHELNLPISTITTNTYMLKKNIMNEKDLKRLNRIETACTMLQQRYNELDYMIKKQTLQELKEKFSLDGLIRSRVDFLQGIYPHINFNLNLQKSELYSDKIGLSKVIDNIIDNGVKYSPNANIIDIKLFQNTLQIQDYGCGMDEIELLQIFDNYYQSNKNMQGFGIGLSMVKRFCDMQNIQLSFKSQPNHGTTVLLKFKEM